MSLPRVTFVAILAGTAIWCALILGAPFLAQVNSPLADPLYDGFHRVCHQFGDRSLHIGEEPLPVCARCTAIYFSFLGGVLLYPLVRRLKEPRVPSRLVVFGAAIPMVIDVAAGMLGLHDSTIATRLITGTAFGVIIAFVVLPVAIEAVGQLVPTSSTFNKEKGTADACKSQ